MAHHVGCVQSRACRLSREPSRLLFSRAHCPTAAPLHDWPAADATNLHATSHPSNPPSHQAPTLQWRDCGARRVDSDYSNFREQTAPDSCPALPFPHHRLVNGRTTRRDSRHGMLHLHRYSHILLLLQLYHLTLQDPFFGCCGRCVPALMLLTMSPCK